ncbi:hypothetical protein HMPREF1545_00212 [Oscillibacter sp. KLE 1728]|nr:hypothetical protein HMPREF1545_00212 [Oscillibacter sp. KLE 1728]
MLRIFPLLRSNTASDAKTSRKGVSDLRRAITAVWCGCLRRCRCRV